MSDVSMNRPSFGGQPGEPVPEVSPEDLKATWEFLEKLQVEHPSQQVATEADVVGSLCKPGAQIHAVYYRSTVIWMMMQIAPEQIAAFMKRGQPTDAVFRAAAKIPLEWMGVEVDRHSAPFDVNQFLQLCAGDTEKANTTS